MLGVWVVAATILAGFGGAETAQHAYDELRARMDRVKTLSVTFERADGNAWTQQHTFSYATHHRMSCGYPRLRTDGHRTYENCDYGSFNRPYRPRDLVAPVGFESFLDPPPKVVATGDVTEVRLNAKTYLTLRMTFNGGSYMLYLDPQTRLPAGSQEIDEGGPRSSPDFYWDVFLDRPQPPDLYRVTYPKPAKVVMAYLKSTGRRLGSEKGEIQDGKNPPFMSASQETDTLSGILGSWPWTNSAEEDRTAEPAVYNLRDCYRIGRHEGQGKVIWLYVSAQSWLPVGYEVHEGTAVRYVGYRFSRKVDPD